MPWAEAESASPPREQAARAPTSIAEAAELVEVLLRPMTCGLETLIDAWIDVLLKTLLDRRI